MWAALRLDRCSPGIQRSINCRDGITLITDTLASTSASALVAAPQNRRIDLAVGSIAYTVAGAGPALLLVHGLGGTRQTWQYLIDDLARTHTVIAPDLPGHGESDLPAGDYSLGAYACALRDLTLALGHRRFSVAGHSLGGGIALQTAYQFPERVDRLLLISSGGLGPEVSVALRAATLPGADAIIAALGRLPTAVTSRTMAALPALVSGPDAEQIADLLSALRDRKQRTAFIRTARSVINWRGQAVSARRHTGLLHGVPVFAAWGSADTTIPPDHHREFAARVPDAVTVEIDGAGHYPHETHSARLLEPIQDFLASTKPCEYSEQSWVRRLRRAGGFGGVGSSYRPLHPKAG